MSHSSEQSGDVKDSLSSSSSTITPMKSTNPFNDPTLQSTNPFSKLVLAETQRANQNTWASASTTILNQTNTNTDSGIGIGIGLVTSTVVDVSSDPQKTPRPLTQPYDYNADTVYEESEYFEDELFEGEPIAFAAALFDYIAVNEDELSLTKGASVMVYSKEEAITGDIGWWLGRIDTSVGVFPLNYVEETAKTSTEPVPPKSRLFEIKESELVKHKLIGIGGFGRVFYGDYGSKPVAIKELICTGVSERDIQTKYNQLRIEAELLAVFSHRNITTLYGVVTQLPSIKMVMEYAAGGSLASVLSNHYLQRTVILDWAFQIARGLNYLHNESPIAVVHRDLKSANVLLTKVGENGSLVTAGNVLKITDFGLARRCTRSAHESGTKGTYQWMAPESIRVGSYSPASDIWGYGVMVWELLTSQIPYSGLPWQTVAYMVGVGGSSLPLPSECPAPFDTILTVCWSKDPCDRPNVKELVARLQEAMDSADASAMNSTLGKSQWGEMQAAWKDEMTNRFKNLEKTEQEMETQQAALRGVSKRQTQHQQELDDWESALARREMELQYRELKLMVDVPAPLTDRRPTPLRRKTRPTLIQKSDIGRPKSFIHVMHLSNDGTPSLADAHGISASPILANSKTISPVIFDHSSSHNAGMAARAEVGSQKCPRCSISNPAMASYCKVCNAVFSSAMLGMGSKKERKGSKGSQGKGTLFGRSTSRSQSRSPRSSDDVDVTNTDTAIPYNELTKDDAEKRVREAREALNRTHPPTGDSDFESRLQRNGSLPTARLFGDAGREPLLPRRSSNSETQNTKRGLFSSGFFRRTASSSSSNATLSPTSPNYDKSISFSWQHDPSVNWFYPKLSREDTRNYCRGKPVGSFVVRVSKSNQASLAICVVQEKNKMWHGLIVYDGFWRMGVHPDTLKFSSPVALINHYTTRPYHSHYYLVKALQLTGPTAPTPNSQPPKIFLTNYPRERERDRERETDRETERERETDYPPSDREQMASSRGPTAPTPNSQPPKIFLTNYPRERERDRERDRERETERETETDYPPSDREQSEPILMAIGRQRSLSSMDLMNFGRSPPQFAEHGSITTSCMSDDDVYDDDDDEEV